ncbi:MAG: hypothetical protein KAH44_29825, partial [Oricola sp.]|nr:hypothetical protein [Oricola sp.]
MKAIGKGSLASMLAIGLHVTRIILWIALCGLLLAMIIVPLIPFFAGAFSDADISIDGNAVDEFLDVANTFVTFAVMLYVVERLLEILKTLRFGSPFVRENADRFR